MSQPHLTVKREQPELQYDKRPVNLRTPYRFDNRDSLKVYVPMNKVNGKISNPYNNFTEEQAKCMVMTAWIHWQITSKYLDTHFDIMVYPDNF